jgi:hypothetical protein
MQPGYLRVKVIVSQRFVVGTLCGGAPLLEVQLKGIDVVPLAPWLAIKTSAQRMCPVGLLEQLAGGAQQGKNLGGSCHHRH